eukprot:34863-Pyramimonas_sp.AAC.1
MLRPWCHLCVGKAGGNERDSLRARGYLDPSVWSGRVAGRWSVQDGLGEKAKIIESTTVLITCWPLRG